MEHEISLRKEATKTGTMVDQPQGQLTDTNPTTYTMFNKEVAISGGTFVQNIGEKGERHGLKLLRKQVASSAFHNSAERIDPARCHPDTRIDVMQTIYGWITESGPRDTWLLWLNGAAGAGKSAIMQSVAERCVLATIAIASFFFIRDDSTRNTLAPFVATLVYQLIQQIPETSDHIFLTIERNPLIFKQSLESQLHQLLIQPLLHLPTHLQRLFVVFIDGLDECLDRGHQSHLIKLLGNVSSESNISVIFVIASRREPQIEAEFFQVQVANILTTIPLDEIQASDDIRWFLNAKFREIKATHLRRKFLSPDWPTSADIEQIVEKSSGQFIYASVVISYISLPRRHPALQLDILNGIRPRNPSENPFAHLDALYAYIFSQVTELDAVQNILALHLSISGLPIRGIEMLFQLAPGELEVLFSDLTSVIQCSGPFGEAVIEILHASLPDFLQDPSRSGDYYINLDEYKANILCMLLERPSSIPSSHASAYYSKSEPDLKFGEIMRLLVIDNLLGMVQASDRLRRACMNFDCIIYKLKDSANALENYRSRSRAISRHLRNMDLKDGGEAYRHVLGVFASGLSK